MPALDLGIILLAAAILVPGPMRWFYAAFAIVNFCLWGWSKRPRG